MENEVSDMMPGAPARPGMRLSELAAMRLVDAVDLRLLLQRALSLSHVQLVMAPERLLDGDEAVRLNALLERRMKGEPMAYILGEREFYGLLFAVTPDVLVPRPETELLVELALSFLPEGGAFLDLGTGSGAIAVAVARERPDAAVAATDVSERALSLARDNARRILGENHAARFFPGNWFDALDEGARFDVIVSNPPYIPAGDPHLLEGDLRFEPAGALTDGADGLVAYRVLASSASRYLLPGGWLLLEHGHDQAAAVQGMLSDAGFASVTGWQDLAGIGRVSGGVFPG